MKSHHNLTLNQRVFIDWLGCQGGKVRMNDLRLEGFNRSMMHKLIDAGYVNETWHVATIAETPNSYQYRLTEQGLLAFAASSYAALGLLKDVPALELPL